VRDLRRQYHALAQEASGVQGDAVLFAGLSGEIGAETPAGHIGHRWQFCTAKRKRSAHFIGLCRGVGVMTAPTKTHELRGTPQPKKSSTFLPSVR
jgi:hypothetical protein